MALIELVGLAKEYPGRVPALRAMDLTVNSGELLVVLGPSGSGKSTILRLIAGLERPSSGTLRIDGRDMKRVAPHRRDVAMVFQNPALYPHLSVFGNLAFGARGRGVSREVARSRVNNVAGILGLDLAARAKPEQLVRRRAAAGGDRASTGAATRIVHHFDEPFSNLDVPLRAVLREEVIELHRRFKTTLIHVTHDQSEALLMGDRVVIVEQGQLRQCDSPRAVYDRPTHRFVATFVGNPAMNLLPCQIERISETTRFRPIGIERWLPWSAPEQLLPRGWEGTTRIFDLGIRPEAISIRPGDETEEGPGSLSSLSARVRRLEFNGPDLLATLGVGPHRLIARLPTYHAIQDQQRVEVVLDLSKSVWFDQTTGEALDGR